jgi:hypothetical protein
MHKERVCLLQVCGVDVVSLRVAILQILQELAIPMLVGAKKEGTCKDTLLCCCSRVGHESCTRGLPIRSQENQFVVDDSGIITNDSAAVLDDLHVVLEGFVVLLTGSVLVLSIEVEPSLGLVQSQWSISL